MNKKKAFQELQCFSEQIQIAIPSQIHLVSNVVSLLQDRIQLFCELHKIDARNIGVCLHEALANAVIHGNLEVESALKNESPERFDALVAEREKQNGFGTRQVMIKCQLTPKMLKFQVQDEGSGFEPGSIIQPDPGSLFPSGRGILIMRAFMDDVRWNAQGNCITLLKRLDTTPVEQ
jgi:anti-sigma regulatory factor (Ser/Thr protein kinase)